MRLVTFERDRQRRAGALVDGSVVDLAATDPSLPDSVLALLRLGEEGIAAARSAAEGGQVAHPLDKVRLLPPLPRPNSLRDFSLVEEHLLNSIKAFAPGAEIPPEWYEIPSHFKGNPDEVYGPDDMIPWPSYTDQLDFELEIAIVIGTRGRGIPVEEAAGYIAGYTILNDWTARDLMGRELRLSVGPGISKDFAYGLGPCITTPDEFDRDNAHLEVRVDGEVWSTSRLRMQFSFEEVIAWVSQAQAVHPGDVLGSGTVGRGSGIELQRWLTEGAVVELEAEGIGVLRNRVGAKGAEVPPPSSQRLPS